MKRFGNNGAVDEYEAFAAVRHTGTLAEFVADFEARLALVPDLAYHQYLGFFMVGLRPEVRMQMKAAKITNYADAVQFALDVDQVAGNPRPTPQYPMGTGSATPQASTPSRSFKKGPSPSFSAQSVTGPHRNQQRNFRHMSSEEYRRHLAAETCFKCGLKFGPTHRCPPKTLNVMVYDDEEDGLDDASPEESEVVDMEVELRLSELSFNGLDTSQTMKMFGSLKDSKLLVMVDSEASHCFISDRVAKELRFRITPTKPYAVRLGDGSQVMAAGICHNISLQLASEVFIVSCYVFPLRSIDIILGVSWLRSLGDVMANWDKLYIKFPIQGRPVTLQGDPTLTRRACSVRDIHALEAGDEGWILCSLSDSPSSDFEFAESLPTQARQQLRDLAAAFPTVLCPTGSLSPSRRTDHRIPLQPGSAPVSVRPYRYNHLQKDEMERLVAEMLASGVIQPSTSPYSSPVLLVRKKDGSCRFCVDYRELNKRTVPDKYPIPVIQELLDELHGAQWFSKLDLKAGYHQIRVAPSNVSKTAFRTHSGHYEFLVMPFGLTNAPATFQSLMNDIFRPLLRKHVLVFFDDILVYSKSWEAHLLHLRQVLHILQTHSLVLNPKKCEDGSVKGFRGGLLADANDFEGGPRVFRLDRLLPAIHPRLREDSRPVDCPP